MPVMNRSAVNSSMTGGSVPAGDVDRRRKRTKSEPGFTLKQQSGRPVKQACFLLKIHYCSQCLFTVYVIDRIREQTTEA